MEYRPEYQGDGGTGLIIIPQFCTSWETPGVKKSAGENNKKIKEDKQTN